MAQLADTSDLLDGDGKQCLFRTCPQWQPHKRQFGLGQVPLISPHAMLEAIDVLVCHSLVTSSLYSLPYADEKQWPLIHSTG